MSLYRWLNKRHHDKTMRRLGRSAERTTHSKWVDWLADRALRDSIRKSRPWWLKTYDSVYVFLFGWNGLLNHKLNPRLILNSIVWRRQRAKRGWADRDTWSLDSYIAKVISEMLVYLADHTHSYPGGGSEWPTPEDWDTHLRDLARRMTAWSGDDWCDDDAYATTKAAMAEFAENFGHYWD